MTKKEINQRKKEAEKGLADVAKLLSHGVERLGKKNFEYLSKKRDQYFKILFG